MEPAPTPPPFSSPESPPRDLPATPGPLAEPAAPPAAPETTAEIAAYEPPLASAPELTPPPLLTPPPPSPFIFHGSAREYFRVWIVNTLLSLLTCGVFIAWAKVRKRRYLRGNTELLGHRFHYTANPRRILVGNVIVVVLFLAYALFGSVYPWVRITALVIGVLLLPWIVVRSLAFNAHHTVYRGLRFHFHPSLSAAVLLYLFKPLLIPLTLGFYYPAWARDKQEFFIARHRLGTGYFRTTLRNGPFYRAYLIAGAVLFVWFGGVGATFTWFAVSHRGHAPSTAQMVPFLVLNAAAFYLAKHFIFAQLFNVTWNASHLDDARFHAHLRTGRWLSLQITNLLAIIGSAGLLYPWAVIRSTRYALSCLTFTPDEEFEKISRMGEHDGSAVGDTAAEFVGLDFGL